MELFDKQKIKKILKDKGLTYDEFAKISGVPHQTLRRILGNATANPRLDTIQAIYKALGLIDEDKREQYQQNTREENIQIFKDKFSGLNDEQKKIILAIAENFAKGNKK